MRFEERCSCGAEIVLSWDAAFTVYRGREEAERAAKEIATWRRLHRRCVRLGQGQVRLDNEAKEEDA
ncbi:MAG: hypothetical protein KatS3mg015_2837 [Fimbriimonadales bacterium]|nr:MAG: hypothetical protein KatS3mg015_2837 [Fimbriimonadales bacterium]